MITLLLIILILSSVILMGVVLMQSSKGNGLAGPIGGSSVTMAFGVRRTSDFLSKATTVLAAIIMVGSIAVNLLVGNSSAVNESIIQKNAGQQQPPLQNAVPPIETTPPAGTQESNQGVPPVEGQQDNVDDAKKDLEGKKPQEVPPAGP